MILLGLQTGKMIRVCTNSIQHLHFYEMCSEHFHEIYIWMKSVNGKLNQQLVNWE